MKGEIFLYDGLKRRGDLYFENSSMKRTAIGTSLVKKEGKAH